MLEKAVFYAEYQSLTSQGHSGLEMIFTASLIGWEEGGGGGAKETTFFIFKLPLPVLS